MRYFGSALLISILLICNQLVVADEYDQKYSYGDNVILFANKVGPFRNPQEVYGYYILPLCKPEELHESRFEGLGEALQGYELVATPMKFNFKKSIDKESICSKTYGEEDLKTLEYAISNQWWYQMFMDDLPIWGMVGESVPDPEAGSEKYFIYTHSNFIVSYNKDRIIEVNLTTENPVQLIMGTEISYTYSITWQETDLNFEHRFEKYLDYNFFEHQIHWFSIFNSFMMVIFLVGLVTMILMRTLKRDFARYAREDEDPDDRDVGEETGWKQIRGDVFRAPSSLELLAALVGTGHQLIVVVFLVILLATLGSFYEARGSTVTAFLVSYSLFSFVGGYSGGGFYARNGGKKWKQTWLMTMVLFPGFCFGVAFLLNFIAIGYHSLAAIPFGSMVAVVAIWMFVSFPLGLLGTVVGKHWNGEPDNPCKITPVRRHIPPKRWYLEPAVLTLLGGVLPFGSIFIEMYFIFTSFWHYKYYYVYGFMFLVLLILIVVTVCVTIVATYFLLNAEDHRWHWTAFTSGASTALYVFFYGVYYFVAKTKMNGFFQTCFYFGYTSMFCVGLGLACGAVGFIGTSVFVKRIYRGLKLD